MSNSQNKQYPKEVVEIHNEFEIVCKRLLHQSIIRLKNLNPNDKKIEKAKRLRALGFIQAKEADIEKNKEIIKEGEISFELAKKIQYYQQQYPNFKFIDEEQLKIICTKYNLVYGKVNRYKGFIPENNLQIIERFKIKDEDKDEDIWSVEKSKATGLLNRVADGWEEYDDDGLAFQLDKYKYKLDYRPAKLKICAPINDMDISGMTLTDNYKLELNVVLDPIVLQPVNKGYLIVTAWGDEASDEILVNPKHN